MTQLSISAQRYFFFQCFDIGFTAHFGGNYHVKLSNSDNIFDTGCPTIRKFYRNNIYIEIGHDITILKMPIFDTVDFIEIEQER